MIVPDFPIRPPTARQLEILQLVSIGYRDKEIARQLAIQRATVSRHVHTMLLKTNTSGRAALVLRAVQLGWILIPESTESTNNHKGVRNARRQKGN